MQTTTTTECPSCGKDTSTSEGWSTGQCDDCHLAALPPHRPTYRPTPGDRVEVFDASFDWVGNGTVFGYLDGVVSVDIDQGAYRHVTLVERVHPIPPPEPRACPGTDPDFPDTRCKSYANHAGRCFS